MVKIYIYFLYQMVLGELESNMLYNEARLSSYTIHKNTFKMEEDLNVRQETFKIL